MNKTFYGLSALLLVLLLSACEKFTDITPKGKNLLQKVSDLENILNFNYSQNSNVMVGSDAAKTTGEDAFLFRDINVMIDDTYPYVQNVNTIIAAPTKTLEYAFLTSDAAVDRAGLTSTDIKYQKYYFIINNVANAVLANVDRASGDRVKANQLKAEAYIIRAYFHYLLVNIYAKAYDPATADKDGGVPYVKEDNILAETNKKSTVAEVYTNIMADIDAALQLNGLPQTPVNSMRAGQALAYALKAKILLTMRQYPEALAVANQSLAINSAVEDHRNFAPVGTSPFLRPLVTPADNLFYAGGGATGPFITFPSLEILNYYYEPGNIVKDYTGTYISGYESLSGVPGSLVWFGLTYAPNTGGMTTSDSYLIKAECLARSGPQQNISEAMSVINYLRQRRIHPNTYAPLTATTEAQAMAHLKKFSRVEFLFSVKNFLNIKRWNTEEAYKETISRTIGGTVYQLKPESPLWIFPFPQNATNYNVNLTQNY